MDAEQAGWRELRVRLVLPAAVLRRAWARARAKDAAEGGRFVAWRDEVVLWADGAATGAFAVRWDDPAPALATVWRVAWDPVRGSELAVRRAVRLLTAVRGEEADGQTPPA